MHKQFRSPTRKPVDTRPPINYSQPQRKMTAPHAHEQQIEQGLGSLQLGDDDETDDFGLVGASAERSPGRISGRNRDTAMFDPMGKRATYLPYGGFDSIIDEYYTEGDPSGIAIPAPSQLQKREVSQSPTRNILHSSSGRKDSLPDVDPRRLADSRLRPDQARRDSGASAQSSRAGSMHSSSPTRGHNNHGFGGREEAVHQQLHEQQQPPMTATNEYYDDEPYYEQEQPEQHRSAPYPDDMAVGKTLSNDGYDDRHYNDRGQPSANGMPSQARARYEGGRAPPGPYNGPPRTQRGPPLRGQRSMEFASQNRPPMNGPPYNAAGGPPMDQRRRDPNGRDPRAMQQDPRLGPRAMMQDPRARQGAFPRQQQQQRPGDQYGRDDRLNMGSRGQSAPYNQRQADPRQRQQPPPMRDPRNDRGNPYPPAPMNSQQQQRRPMQNGIEPPLERLRSPPEPRASEMRMAPDQRRPSPIPNGERGPSPAHQRPTAQGSMSMGQQQQQQQHQQQRPPQQSGPPQQQQQALQQPPPVASSNVYRKSDHSDMAMQPEPARPVTLAEIQSLRKDAAKNSSPQVQLTLVKRLMEAALVLSSEGGKADAKQTKKNRDDYNREALRTLKQITAQEKPFPEAVFFLANCYGNASLSLEVDHERAFQLYEQAAKLQHPASAYRTAVCLEIGAGTRQDVERAVRFYRRAAEYGDAAAMYKIGMILLRGLLSQPADARQALVWLQKAADKADIENPHALHELALLYEKGDGPAGVPLDEAHAKDLFTRAAKLHYAPSQYRLGYAYEYGTLGCPVDPRRSIAWFSRGAERGDPESELSLSGWYLTGSDGILAQNDREAYLWGRKAAEKGLAKAEFAVGYFFESGIGTNVDLDEAVKWYKRAATAGQKKAQERLLALGKRKR